MDEQTRCAHSVAGALAGYDVALLGEPFEAVRELERLHASAGALVGYDVALLGEPLSAERALERLHHSAGVLVGGDVALLGEPFEAVRALERLCFTPVPVHLPVPSHVRVDGSQQGHRPPTLRPTRALDSIAFEPIGS